MGRDAGGRALRPRDALLLTVDGAATTTVPVSGPSGTASSTFSSSYAVARRRFRDAARRAGAVPEAFPIPGRGPVGETLAVDVATVGAARPARAVVVSSGLHGVEGFFGSAVQLAWLEGVRAGRIDVPPGTAVVLVHALNPYGFAWRRRANEGNVDLNRNFLDVGEPYAGVPPLYDRVHRLLNPDAPSARADLFLVRAAWAVCRHGLPALRAAVAEGQYEHPSGLFFGGQGPEASTRLIQEHFWGWTRDSGEVVHLDLHTGLGRRADCQILVEPVHAPNLGWYRARFAPARVVSVADEGAYAARGVMGAWLGRHAAGRRYRFACVEIGTHPPLRVLGALRAENHAHRFSVPGSRPYERAKRELVECFCPGSRRWRRAAVGRALELVARAVAASGDARRHAGGIWIPR
ncbi:MAG: M14 family metallopeptidase [Acidobacteria bacterium]|nr:M14 family metallopeptidase [Acidobacteriota bacterium]